MMYRCSACSAGFTTSSHLRRHEAKHHGSRSYACVFCSKLFGRSDTARRHQAGCPERRGRDEPEERKRGQPRRACTACADAKVRCSGTQPCQRCATSSITCAYAPVVHEHLVDAAEDIRLLGGLTPFLLNFTDGRTRSLVDRFDVHGEHSEGDEVMPGLFLPPFLEAGTLYGLGDAEDDLQLTNSHEDASDQTYSQKRCSTSRLEMLVLALRRSQNARGNPADPNPASDVDSPGYALFEPRMANTLIDTYFNKWHPHAPILHRPLFKPDEIALPLLASVILMGAMFYAQHTAFLAIDCLDLVETFVFDHPDFRRVCESSDMIQSQVTFELLQASIIVVIMQDWGHDLVSRRRMRLHRYIDVIAVARSMNIFSLVHTYASERAAFGEEEWIRYVATEERIRTAAYIYLIDCAWMLFHGTSPRMTTQEMCGHGPSLEAAFQAESAADCAEVLFSRPFDRTLSIANAIAILLQPSGTELTFVLTTLHLFMLIHAIHVALFSSKATCTLQLTRHGLERALRRWRGLWDVSMTTIYNEDYALCGFYRSSPEYCHMGHIMLKAYTASDSQDQPPSTTLDTDTMAPINDLLKHFSDLGIA